MASIFELHPTSMQADGFTADEPIPWNEAKPAARLPAFTLKAEDGLVWLDFDAATGAMTRVPGPAHAVAGLKIVPRRMGHDLALLPRRDGVLVNSLPTGPMQIIGTKDSIVLSPGWLCYVTERVRPYVGPALKEHVGQKCPYCRIPVDEKTRVVTCRCGAIFHHETEISHPDTPEADRLRCFEKIKTCLSCNRELTLEEHLVWDPATM